MVITASSSIEQITEDQFELAESLGRRALHGVVRKAFEESGLRQADVVQLTGIDASTLSKALSSPRNMTVKTASRLLRALGYWIDVEARPIALVQRVQLQAPVRTHLVSSASHSTAATARVEQTSVQLTSNSAWQPAPIFQMAIEGDRGSKRASQLSPGEQVVLTTSSSSVGGIEAFA